MSPATTRYVLALDLLDDELCIADYEDAHKRIWPAVREHLHAQGVLQMEIYRLGTRLTMVMEVDLEIYSAERMSRASREYPTIVHWETLMSVYQKATPWTPDGEKWTLMTNIFDLSAQ